MPNPVQSVTGTPWQSATGLRSWRRHCAWVLLWAGLGGGMFGLVRAADPRQYAIKVGILYHLPAYIQWPPAGAQSQTTFTLGILGENHFGDTLADLAGKTVNGQRLIVKQLTGLEEVPACQAVFISSSEKRRLAEILDRLKQLPVLTIGEASGFARAGGMVNLVEDRNRVRMEVNPAAAGRAGLVFSSQLLKLKLVSRVGS